MTRQLSGLLLWLLAGPALAGPALAGAPALSPFPGQDTFPAVPLRDIPPDFLGWTAAGDEILAATGPEWGLADLLGDVHRPLACAGAGGPLLDAGVASNGYTYSVLTSAGRVCTWNTGNGGAGVPIGGRGWRRIALHGADTIGVGHDDGLVELRDLHNGRRLWKRNLRRGAITGLRFDAHAARLVASTANEGAAIFETRFGRLVHTVGIEPTFSVALDPKNPRVALGLGAGRVEIWDLKSWRRRETLRIGADTVEDLDYSRDGTLLAVLTGNTESVTFHMWELATGSELFRETAPRGPGLARFRFSPWGDRVIATSGGGLTRIWNRPLPPRIPSPPPNFEPPRPRTYDERPRVPDADLAPAAMLPETTLTLDPTAGRALGRVSEGLEVRTIGAGGRLLDHSAGAEGPVAWSPDGARAAAWIDGRVTLWDVATGRVLARLPSSRPAAIALDGKRIAVVGVDGSCAVAAPGDGAFRPLADVAGATAVALDRRDVYRLAVGTAKGEVRILDTRRPAPVSAWGVHEGPVSALGFSPDGTRLATAGGRPGGGAAVVVLRAGTDELPRPFVVENTPRAIAFSADATRVLVTDDRGATVFDLPLGGAVLDLAAPVTDAVLAADGGTLTVVEATGALRRLAIGAALLPWIPRGARAADSADGRRTATVDGDQVTVWNAMRALRLNTLPPTGQEILRVALTDDGEGVAVVNADHSIEGFHVPSGERLSLVRGSETSAWIRYAPDGSVLWSLGPGRSIVGWDLTTGLATEQLTVPGSGPLRVDEAWSPGVYALVTDEHGLRAWLDTRKDSVRRLSNEMDGSRPLATHPASPNVAMVHGDEVVIVNAAGARAGSALRHEGDAPGFAGAFSADGAHLAVAYASGAIRVWNLTTRKVAATLGVDSAKQPPLASLSFDRVGPDVTGADITGVDVTGRVRRWDWKLVEEHSFVTLSPGDVARVGAVSTLLVAPDGRRLYSAHADGLVRAWDMVTGAQLGIFPGHADVVTALGLTPDGRTLVTGARDATTRLWDTATFVPRFPAVTTGGAMRAVAVSPDGRFMASIAEDGLLRVWDSRTSRPAARWSVSGDATLRFDGGTLIVTTPETAAALDAATGARVEPPAPPVAAPSGAPPSVRLPALGDLPARFGPVTMQTVTPDGLTLVTASADGRIRLWDIPTRTCRATLTSLTDGSWVIDRPDGTRIASASLREGTALRLHLE